MKIFCNNLVAKVLRVAGIIAFGVGLINAEVKEGVDYITLSKPIANAENTLIEIYSYSCPFCYKNSKVLPKIIKNLPEDVSFRPFHIQQKGAYGKQASEVLAVAIIKDKKANIDYNNENSSFHKAESAYYEGYHKQKKWHESEALDIKGFLRVGLNAIGMSQNDFNKALNTKEVKDILKQWKESYDVAVIQGVPAFVVNGKYLIYTKSITSLKDLENKIKELLAK